MEALSARGLRDSLNPDNQGDLYDHIHLLYDQEDRRIDHILVNKVIKKNRCYQRKSMF